jgi:hypothetical protein
LVQLLLVGIEQVVFEKTSVGVDQVPSPRQSVLLDALVPPLRRLVDRLPELIFAALVVSVVAEAANEVPFVFVQVIAPALLIVQSPDKATAVATFDPLPTQISAEVKEGREPPPPLAASISGPKRATARGVVDELLVLSTRPTTCPEVG